MVLINSPFHRRLQYGIVDKIGVLTRASSALKSWHKHFSAQPELPNHAAIAGKWRHVVKVFDQFFCQ